MNLRVVGVMATAVLLGGAQGVQAQRIASNNMGEHLQFSSASVDVRGPGTAAPVQSAAIRFTNCGLTSGITEVVIPLRHKAGKNEFRIEVRASTGAPPLPGMKLGEFAVVQGGSNSEPLVMVGGDGGIRLVAGSEYWLVVHGVGDAEGAWHLSDAASGFRATSGNLGQTWETAGGLALGMRLAVEGEPVAPCYAACMTRHLVCWGSPHTVQIDDFMCWINEFASALALPHEEQIAHYANCDGSTIAPVLNVADFMCFIDAFAQGCS